MNLKEMRAAAIEAAQDAKAAMEADPTDETIKAAQDAATEVKSIDERIERKNDALRLMASLDTNLGSDGADEVVQAKSLGEHFVKSVGDRLRSIKGGRGAIAVPEFKAATDTHVTEVPGGPMDVLLTQVDRTIVKEPRRPTVTGLFGQGRLDRPMLTYFVEQGREGNFETVAETGQMPQIHYEMPTQVTDAVSKIAGFIKLSDEMLEDLDFLVSEIDGRLLYDLSLVEENQVLFGDGLGTNLKGLLNRDGVQTASTDEAGLAEEVFKCLNRISNASGLTADALVINPADYEKLRLAKDANGQYYGGGMFAGQYGVGGIMQNPPVWGLRTVVSPAVAIGAPVVGAFNLGATVYRMGGVFMEATNSDQADFTRGMVTVRATERMGLAVRRPAAFVKIAVS